MSLKDPTLVRRTLAGDTAAFGDLVERYGGLVHGIILERVRRSEDVQDLAQETFCRAYAQLPNLRHPARFAPWLAQIARNSVLRWLQREERRIRTEPAEDIHYLASPVSAPDEDFERREQAAILWDALDRLPPENRHLLVLHYLEGCTFREIARFLDQPLATVQWRLAQSERKLGQELIRGLGGYRLWNDRSRKRLRRQVLASLPLALWHPFPGQTLPGWFPKRLFQYTPSFVRKAVVVSLTSSLLLHLLGVSMVETFQEVADRDIRVYSSSRATRGFTRDRLVHRAPFLPRAELGRLRAAEDKPEPLPEHLEEEVIHGRNMPGNTEPSSRSLAARRALLPERPSFVPEPLPDLAKLAFEDTLGSEELDLLRLRDLARTNAHPATLYPATNPSEIRSYVHFTPLRLYGAGTYSSPGNALADLARYLRDYTPIQARVRHAEEFEGFLSPKLLTYPIHFLLEGGGMPAWSAQWRARIGPEELERLGDYLRDGGFLFIEGNKPWLREMVPYVRQALHSEGELIQVPFSHPLYSAYYDYAGGFPGEYAKSSLTIPAHSWYYPAASYAGPTQYPLGLWGVELKGELVVLFSDLDLLRNWEEEPFADETDRQQIPAKTPALRAATNVVVYALTRSRSLTPRRIRPLWTAFSRPRSSVRQVPGL